MPVRAMTRTDGVRGAGKYWESEDEQGAHQGTERNSAGERARRVIRETRMAPLK
jgi:hypothetical protein